MEYANKVRLIKMWSSGFIIRRHGDDVVVTLLLGTTSTESLYHNETQAVCAVYDRVVDNALMLCKLVERDRRCGDET